MKFHQADQDVMACFDILYKEHKAGGSAVFDRLQPVKLGMRWLSTPFEASRIIGGSGAGSSGSGAVQGNSKDAGSSRKGAAVQGGSSGAGSGSGTVTVTKGNVTVTVTVS